MNTKFAAIAALGAMSLAAIAPQAAAADNGFYIGAGVTQTNFDIDSTGDDDVDDVLDDLLDESNNFKIIVGWRALDWLALEANYIDTGGGEIGDGVSSASIDTNAITVSGLLIAEIGIVDLFAKVGVAQWNADLDFDDPQFEFSESEDGTDVLYGAGVGLHFGSLGLRAEYETFDADGLDVNTLSLSFTYTFL